MTRFLQYAAAIIAFFTIILLVEEVVNYGTDLATPVAFWTCLALIPIGSRLSYLLAKQYHRNAAAWAVRALIAPGFALVVLLLLGDPTLRGHVVPLSVLIKSAISNKSCSACGRRVPMSAASGRRCPFCGSLWNERMPDE